VDNNVNKQNSYERNNRQAFSMDTGLAVFGTSTDRAVGSGDRSGADVCIWLRTHFGWKTEFVSGNCVREAREFIPWTMKTFDRRGW
jgi:hypothetical protein